MGFQISGQRCGILACISVTLLFANVLSSPLDTEASGWPGTQSKPLCQGTGSGPQKRLPGLGSALGLPSLLFRTDSKTAQRNSVGGQGPAVLEAAC